MKIVAPRVVFPSSDNEVNGILHKFGKTNLPYTIESSPTYEGKPENVFDPNNTEFWSSQPDEYSNISIHFVNHKISLSHYGYMSFPYPCENHSHAKKWIVEGFNDKGEKFLIDNVTNNPACGYNKIVVRTIYSKEFFSSIRFTQMDINGWGTNHFVISQIDFYGVVQGNSFSPFKTEHILIKMNHFTPLLFVFELTIN